MVGDSGLIAAYLEDSAAFWGTATDLIRRFADGLKSLSMIGHEGWIYGDLSRNILH